MGTGNSLGIGECEWVRERVNGCVKVCMGVGECMCMKIASCSEAILQASARQSFSMPMTMLGTNGVH